MFTVQLQLLFVKFPLILYYIALWKIALVDHLVAYALDQQRRAVSNELFVTLPLNTEEIVLPGGEDQVDTSEGSQKRTLPPADENLDDIYKEVLKIQPGSPLDGTCLLCSF